MKTGRLVSIVVSVGLLTACSDAFEPNGEQQRDEITEKSLSPQARLNRLKTIRDVARNAGLKNAAMLAGIASAETGLAHCWSEAQWSCKGPWSADCNGSVIAGAGDGPCAWQEGGLGMFQFDAGTFDDTLRRDGAGVLTLGGNIQKAVDFVAKMLINSRYVSVNSRAAALDWLSNVRPGTSAFDQWIKTVTHHYNGCEPNYCSIFWSRFDHYAYHARLVYNDTASDFWTQSNQPERGPQWNAPTTVDALEVWWSRLNDGSYAFKSIAPSRVVMIRYSVDGYVIADDVKRDDDWTAEVENNFPARYRFSSSVPERKVLVEGYDDTGRLVARGVGLLDAIEGTAVYIRQVGSAKYQIGLERAPWSVKTLNVNVDGYQLVDAISGGVDSDRLAVRSDFNALGERTFRLVGKDASGNETFSAVRKFKLE